MSESKAPELGVAARAIVQRVVDGDTVDLVMCWPVRVRLKDVWAPETRGANRNEVEAGLASKEALEAMLPVGSHVVLHVQTEQADSLGDVLTFSRVVGSIWNGDRDVGKAMVEAGHATRTKGEVTR